MKGRGKAEQKHTNTLLLIQIFIHSAISIQFSGEDHLWQFSAAGWWTGFGAKDAVEITVEDAGVGRGKAEEDQSVGVGHEVWCYYCLVGLESEGIVRGRGRGSGVDKPGIVYLERASFLLRVC